MIPSFKEKGKRAYNLTSIGAPKDGILPIDTLLFNIFRKLTRRANAMKVIAYLIWHERSRLNFQVYGPDLKRFCNLGSSPDQAFADLEEINLPKLEGSVYRILQKWQIPTPWFSCVRLGVFASEAAHRYT